MAPESPRSRVLLLGLDGATFDLLDRLGLSGKMPGFQRWRDEGASGVLNSTNPPTTPPAWSSCVTGMRPGRHGIYDFREPLVKNPGRPLITNASLCAPTLWERLGKVGMRSCVLNYPIAWPAEPIHGTLVTGFLTPDHTSDYVSPPEEGEALIAAVPNYRPNVDIPRFDAEQIPDALEFLDQLESSLEARIAAFWHFYEREDWDFYFPTFVFHDRLGHLFWKIMAGEGLWPDHPHTAALLPRIEEIYARFDLLLQRLLVEAPPELKILMCSDHGFGGTAGFFEANAWLEAEGLLRLRPAAKLKKASFYAAMELGESSLGKGLVPDALRSRLRRKLRSRRSSFRDDLAEAVDWENTKAVFLSVPLQGIALCRSGDGRKGGVRDEAEAEAILVQITEGVTSLKHPDGMPLFDRIWRREEIYEGPYAHWAPDLVFEARDYSVVGRPVLGARHWFRDASDQPVGFHRMEGVWMAWGDGLATGAKTEPASIEDICPAVLHLLGLPIPEALDGKLQETWFDPAWLGRNPPRYSSAAVEGPAGVETETAPSPPTEGTKGLQRRMEALGYLDLG